MKREDHNFIMMKNEETLSQRGKSMELIKKIDEKQLQKNVNATIMGKIAYDERLQKGRNEECDEKRSETDLSHDKKKPVIEMNIVELITEVSHRVNEGKLLKVVKKE